MTKHRPAADPATGTPSGPGLLGGAAWRAQERFPLPGRQRFRRAEQFCRCAAASLQPAGELADAQGRRRQHCPADWLSGDQRATFDVQTRLQLNDARRALTVPIQADHATYYNNPANPAVDPAIRAGRLLTGADFDIESIRQDRSGNLWFGDEFGPYLIKTNAQGTVLRSEISLPGVYAPQHKDVVAGKVVANLPSSGGFEGMAQADDRCLSHARLTASSVLSDLACSVAFAALRNALGSSPSASCWRADSRRARAAFRLTLG
ncbi:MAG: esterase-like activity of phytase family protein [Burkholderiaceae bacterium]